MTNLFTAKTNFTSGELSESLLGRVDLKAYDNGALALKNVFIEPTGGVYRRPGLKYIASLNGKGRLIIYEKSYHDVYVLILQNQRTDIYLNDTYLASLTTPWTADQINSVRWCQGVDALYLVHPDVAPQKMVLSGTTWTLVPFTFLTEDGCIRQPYHKFCDDGVTLAATDVTGTVTLTASAAVFQNKHIGRQFKIGDGYVQITAVTDSTHAASTVLKKLVTDGEGALEPTRSWGEPAFDSDYGYPKTVAFFQSRLVFGGSRSLPNTLWFSQSGDLTNFELGEGYDAEGIEFSILSDQANAICALYAGRHLQVFTTNAEWMVSGDPLTPVNIQLRCQTQVGSPDDRFVPPIGIDGATIFPATNGCEIREFLFANVEQAYQATDLSLMSGHLIHDPQDQAYDKQNRLAYIIMQNGKCCSLTSYRAEDVQSWAEQITDGDFISVGCGGGDVWFIIRRGENYYLEKLDADSHTDCAFHYNFQSATATLTGLSVLNGKKVKIVADGISLPDQVVQDGSLTLERPALKAEVGLPFTHRIVPLPPSAGVSNATAPISSARLVRGVFRVVDTQSLEIDTGTGLHQVLVRPLASYQLDTIPPKQTLDVVVRSLGWTRTPTDPLWRIEGDSPKPFKLVSVTSDIQIGG